VPVANADAAPLQDYRHLIGVAVDAMVETGAAFVPQPSLRGGDKAEICGEEAASLAQNPSAFTYGGPEVGNVDQRQVADNQVEALRFEGQRLADASYVDAARVPHTRAFDQRLRRVESRTQRTALREKAAEAALATAEVEHPEPIDLTAEFEHDVVEQELAVWLAVDDVQPAACRRFPAAIGP
jgi:hypothetical protein